MKYLGGEVFEDGGEVNRGSGANTFGVLSGLEESGDPTDGELETGLGRSRHGFCGLGFSSSTFGI